MRLGAMLFVTAACGRLSFDGAIDDARALDGATDDATDGAIDGAIDGALPVCAAAYNLTFGTSRYRHAAASLDWFAAEADCESDGGHLVVPETAPENTFALQMTTHPSWIGASDHVTEGTFLTVINQPVLPMFWTAGEPSNGAGVEDCVHQLVNGEWNDVECASGVIDFVCECDGTAAAATYCDTSQEMDCGMCGTACVVPTVCTNQVCL